MGLIGLTLSVISIICVWLFPVEFIWQVTITVFASIEILASTFRFGIMFGELANLGD